jgi:hypothetical protein
MAVTVQSDMFCSNYADLEILVLIRINIPHSKIAAGLNHPFALWLVMSAGLESLDHPFALCQVMSPSR